jgi:ABC-2 type transport system ATP-binding protein
MDPAPDNSSGSAIPNGHNAIRLDRLSRTFGTVTAVDDVSLDIPHGEIFGLLGPNGAGKTTIINMLITLLRPSGGTALVAGFDITRNQDDIRRHIGIIFQDPSLDSGLTGRENIEFHAMMYGMARDHRKARIDEVLEVVDLADKADQLVQQYSGGMKRRLEIARGLVHEPRILFLDEPTLGLDAQTRRNIWGYIKNLNKKYGITVILTTHYMEEADFLCDRIAIIDQGKIIALDTPKNLKHGMGGDILELETDEDQVNRLAQSLRSLPGTTAITPEGIMVSVAMAEAERRLPSIIAHVQNEGIPLHYAGVRKPSLEEVFIRFTGTQVREQVGSLSDMKRSLTVRRMRR